MRINLENQRAPVRGRPGLGNGNFEPMGTHRDDGADRRDIDDLLTRYATALDSRSFELLAEVFTVDAVLDYRSAGGIKGQVTEVLGWLEEVLSMFDWTQHLVINRDVRLDADRQRGTSRAAFLNPNQLQVDGGPWLFTVGGYYSDVLVRTELGWRISRRVEETLWWDHPIPGLPATPSELDPGVFS